MGDDKTTYIFFFKIKDDLEYIQIKRQPQIVVLWKTTQDIFKICRQRRTFSKQWEYFQREDDKLKMEG